MNKDNKEIEIKIKLDDVSALFKRALELGGVELPEKEGQERDVMYDDGKGFYDYPKVLRLRTTSHGNFLTYKEKNDESDSDNFLVRTEIETEVHDPGAVDLILQKLGFFPYRIKEKFRREIKLGELVIEFHRMPFLGEFIEIEGAKDDVISVLTKLDLQSTQGINLDYSALFYKYCDEHGLSKDTAMTFEAEQHHLQK